MKRTLCDAFDRWKDALIEQDKQTTRAARHRAHVRTAPPVQENGAAISFGIAQFDIGAILGSVLAPAEAYVLPPPHPVISRRTRKSYSDRSYSRSKTPSPVAA